MFGPRSNTRCRSAGCQEREARNRRHDEESRAYAMHSLKARLGERRPQPRLAAQPEGRRKAGRPGADEDRRGQRALLEFPDEESPAGRKKSTDFLEAHLECPVIEVL